MFHFRGPWTSLLLCFRLRYQPGHAARHSDMPDHRQAGPRRIGLLHQRGHAFAVTRPYLRRIGSQPTSHKDPANHGRAGPARGPVDYTPDRFQQPAASGPASTSTAAARAPAKPAVASRGRRIFPSRRRLSTQTRRPFRRMSHDVHDSQEFPVTGGERSTAQLLSSATSTPARSSNVTNSS